MDKVFQCVAPTLCLDWGKHAVAGSKSSWVFLENKKMNPIIAASYSIFDHVMEMLKSGIKINNGHYFCRGCKKIRRKSIIPKCTHCQSDVKMCQAWLVAALSGGFQDLYTGLSSEISSTKDPRTQQKTWLNLLLGKLLTFWTEGQTYRVSIMILKLTSLLWAINVVGSPPEFHHMYVQAFSWIKPLC